MKSISTNAELKAAIETLVDYNWVDEQEDYRKNPLNKAHIYHTLCALSDWIDE